MKSPEKQPKKNLSSPNVGIVEWFRIGEHERAESVLADLKELDVRYIRTGLSWADRHVKKGRDWYDWLIPRLAENLNVLPCFTYTPPSLGIMAKASSPPRNPKMYADFPDLIITRYDQYLNMSNCGKLNLKALMTHEFQLQEVSDAFVLMRSGPVVFVKAIVRT